MSNQNIEQKKAQIRQRYKGIDQSLLEVIPAEVPKKLNEDNSHKRVAVYARVSTDNVEQTSSYELQKNHYEDFVNHHPGWELIDIYADEGISGTSLKHRDSFLRMIEDCKAGKIDLIITKSIARFARNTLDCIANIRELKGLSNPVGVFFETENLYTLDKNIEMILTLLATVAQEESHTKSEIMNVSIDQRFSRGIFLTPALLGFDKDEDGNLVINEEEAETVRITYYMFIEGYTTLEIADFLNTYKRTSKLGNIKWTRSAVIALLKNERYCGDVLSRKTFTPNFLDHKAKKNKKNRPQYRQRDHHEAIVSRLIYNIANKLLAYNRLSRKGKPLPQLKVVKEGFLRGFVPVARSWGGFLLDDYSNASNSGFENLPIEEKKRPRFQKFTGYYMVREQFFSPRECLAVWFSITSICFNTNCLKKFKDIEYVELLFNAVNKKLVIRPCNPDNPNAIKWGKIENGKWRNATRSCRAFSKTLFESMEWDEDNKYRIRGQYLTKNNTRIIVFVLEEPEIIIKTGKRKSVTELGGGISNTFGPSYAVYAVQQSLFEEYEDYSATPVLIEGQEILTEEDMAEIRNEKYRIIELWKERLLNGKY